MSDCGLSGITFTQPSLVKPQFAADADIGLVVKRFLRTGVVPEVDVKPNLGDSSTLPEDFQQLMDQNTQIRQQFELLSEEERAKYNNSCDNWLSAMAEKTDQKTDQKIDEKIDEKIEEKVEVKNE